MNIFLGAENIVSPLGNGIDENFGRAVKGETGLRLLEKPFDKINSLYAAQLTIPAESKKTKFDWLCENSISGSLKEIVESALSERWLFVLSTTKGDVDYLAAGDFEKANPNYTMAELSKFLPFSAQSKIISCACISGLAATIYAADMIKLGHVDHALVLGADVLSAFTTRGFDSFYALDPKQCMPFDRNRKGLNLGEAAASIVLSKSQSTFKKSPLRYKSGATSNDANHISGPSRTGEGLFRAISNTLKASEIKPEEIDYISAHGTGTAYNDDMESIAFSRIGISNSPLNSLKGFYGHTLGASSLVELAMGMQSMRNSVLLKNFGCAEPGTAEPLNTLKENLHTPVKTMLKTASGFGGCNAAAIIQS